MKTVKTIFMVGFLLVPSVCLAGDDDEKPRDFTKVLDRLAECGAPRGLLDRVFQLAQIPEVAAEASRQACGCSACDDLDEQPSGKSYSPLPDLWWLCLKTAGGSAWVARQMFAVFRCEAEELATRNYDSDDDEDVDTRRTGDDDGNDADDEAEA